MASAVTEDKIAQKVDTPGHEVVRVASLRDDEKESEGSSADSIIEGSEGVTEHELATLRHVADRLPYTAWLVVIVEFAERSVFFSGRQNFQ